MYIESLERILADEIDRNLPELVEELVGFWALGFIVTTGRNDFGYVVVVRDDLSEEEIHSMNIPTKHHGFDVFIEKGKVATAYTAIA